MGKPIVVTTAMPINRLASKCANCPESIVWDHVLDNWVHRDTGNMVCGAPNHG